MSVLLPNARLGLRRRINEQVRNEHGERVAAGWGGVVGLFDGRLNETAGGTWNLGLDPALWPVRQGDLAISSDGAAWVIQTADLIQNNYDSTVDWVRATALRRSAGGTEPGGAWFVARYADDLGPGEEADPSRPPVLNAGLWTGYGPPPDADFGAKPGDEYMDLLSGTVYRLGEG